MRDFHFSHLNASGSWHLASGYANLILDGCTHIKQTLNLKSAKGRSASG
jgi:hypothetical protein